MNTQRFTIKSQEALQAMQNLATAHGHQEINSLHLLAAMLQQPDTLIVPVLQKLEIDPGAINSQVEDALRNAQ
jgi:ATP-dependent Clp protease ATP-binding subunit ClpB